MAKKSNAHFSAEGWVDFAMQQVSEERLEAMKHHLSTGCAECSDLAHLWTRVAQVSRRESGHEPPATAVRHVRDAFAIMAEAERSKRALTIPRLVFDTLWQPALAGVRSTQSTPRQVLYRAGEVSIEMLLEREPRSERVNVAGQISTAALQGEGIAGMLVTVICHRGLLTSTSTNQFGEFHIAFVPEAGLRISFGAAHEKELSIPLDGTGLRLFYRN
jgi:hypothetical protein